MDQSVMVHRTVSFSGDVISVIFHHSLAFFFDVLSLLFESWMVASLTVMRDALRLSQRVALPRTARALLPAQFARGDLMLGKAWHCKSYLSFPSLSCAS